MHDFITAGSKEEFIAEAAGRIEAHAAAALEEAGRAAIALSGGNTPREINRLWAESSALEWKSVVLLFGDERCVPPDHPDSNYGMAEETLLRHLAERPTVHRMTGEDPDPDHAAADYGEVMLCSGERDVANSEFLEFGDVRSACGDPDRFTSEVDYGSQLGQHEISQAQIDGGEVCYAHDR